MREVLGRVLDGSLFDEYKALYGPSIVTGWGSVHGFAVGVIANQQGVIFSEEAHKATEFIMLCNRYDLPIIFIHNTTGYMVGRDYEQRGIIKDGAKMINAVANSTVPHISLLAGVSYGAGNYGMSGRAYDPRFMFGWPNHKIAVMGPKQLAGVMSIIRRAAAESRGEPYDDELDAGRPGEDREPDLSRGTRLLRHFPHLGRRPGGPPGHPHRPGNRPLRRLTPPP